MVRPGEESNTVFIFQPGMRSDILLVRLDIVRELVNGNEEGVFVLSKVVGEIFVVEEDIIEVADDRLRCGVLSHGSVVSFVP